MGSSFHVYPSAAQYIDAPPNQYSRATPLACDTIETNTVPRTVGYFDTTAHCYVALVPQVVRFHAHLLWQNLRDGQTMNCWFMVNQLPPPDGSVGGETAGCDVPVKGSGNQSCSITRQLQLQAGDRVWCVPGCAGGGQLTNAVAGNGRNTVNYFEGEVLEVL